ncbi:hypothetical protein [Kerstersia similis]|uniref:hypothetical protein n=1 Tax=Kerstersia similis TaxID=206505 RepID=UPI0039F0C032
MTTETVLTDAQIFDCFDRECAEMVINFDADELYPVGRAIERAVLQSPEVQRMREEAAMYRWVRSNWGRISDIYLENSGLVLKVEIDAENGWHVDADSLDAAIKAAMGEKE